MKKVIGLLSAALCGFTALPATAQVVLTANIEPATTFVRNFNPFSQTSARQSTLDFMYEPLVIFNRFDDNKANYRLAESYQIADDLMSITFTLRDALKWSDGAPLTAADVVFTYNYVKQHPALDFVSIWEFITGVEQVDATTVKFTLVTPSALAADRLIALPIVPEHIWKDIADPVTFANEEPVASGALTEIPRFTPQTYDQCRNPHYWDTASLAVDCMRFPQLANNNQILTALASGEIDWGVGFVPDVDKTFVAKDPEHHKYWYTAGSMVTFIMNQKAANADNQKAFTDLNFRRAISMTLDRQSMVDIAGYGYPVINEDPTTFGQVYASWADPKIVEEFGQFTRFNIDAANALLDEAGYKDTNGDGFRDNPDGTSIAFNIIVPGSWTDWIDTVQIAIEGMNEVGINASMATPEEAVWSQNLISGNYDVAITSFSAAATPYYPYQRAFTSAEEGKTRFTAQRWFNPEIEELLAEFARTPNQDDQKVIMGKAQRIVAENLPLLPIFNSATWYQYNTKRFSGWADAEHPFVNPTISRQNPARILHLLNLKPNS